MFMQAQLTGNSIHTPIWVYMAAQLLSVVWVQLTDHMVSVCLGLVKDTREVTDNVIQVAMALGYSLQYVPYSHFF